MREATPITGMPITIKEDLGRNNVLLKYSLMTAPDRELTAPMAREPYISGHLL
jgi:hypothetical protein